MDMLIVEFLVGVLAGTVFGLLIVRRSGSPSRTQRTKAVVGTAATKTVATYKQSRTRNTRHKRLHHGQARRLNRSSNTITNLASRESAPLATFLSCPSCGLQAPEILMTEHFLGSPSHQYQPVEAPLLEASLENKAAAVLSEEDQRDSLRNLLQMLVPPRAFGRRHGQRSIDPLASIVRSIDGSRTAV